MTGEELALIVVASLVGSFVKSVTGMGYPVVAIPLLSLFIDVEDAVVIVALPNAAANLLLNIHARRAARESRDLVALSVAAVLGALAGTAVLVRVPDEPLLLALAATVLVYVIQ
ncbi:MAG: TSUP family transporter, partial [Ilumatobacteraceae bacterium]